MLTAAQNQLQRATPEAQGIASAAILGFVAAVEQQIRELHSFILLRHGSVVAEGWWSPYAPERPHMLFSLSKSFTSSAVGLAVMEGRLSVDDTVLSFFPDESPAQVDENLAVMKVRHLLSMSTGHAEDTMPHLREAQDGNWIKAFLALPVTYVPGTHFLYNTGASYMLSAIIQRLTGVKLLDYLRPRLLEPLGIEDAVWEVSPQGINTGGYGLSIKTEDIAKFGQLYLQKGLWNGSRVLSESWIEAATSRQVSNGSSEVSDWEQGYGYQFWRCRHNIYRGDGAFGQYCIVMPDQDAVLAITSGVADMQSVLNLVWDHLLPAMDESSLPDDPVGARALADKLASLALLPPPGDATSPLASQVAVQRYAVESNEFGVEEVALEFSDSVGTLTALVAAGAEQVTFGYGEWREGSTALFGGEEARTVASGVWTAEDTLALTVRRYETPFVHTLIFRFSGAELRIEGDVNVGFEAQKMMLIAHRAAS